MRPGQLTPENQAMRVRGVRSAGRFNEAGAINPGKQRKHLFMGALMHMLQ